MENKTVYFSLPDSTGKQYPVKESSTNIDKQDKERQQIDETLLVSVQYLSEKLDTINAKVDAMMNQKEKVIELSWWDLYKDKV